MALAPCDADGTRFPGPATYLYPAIVQGGTILRARWRLCPSHATGILYSLEQVTDEEAPGVFVPRQPETCPSCRLRIAEQEYVHLFLTAYPTKDNRVDYHVWMCAPCVRGWDNTIPVWA